MSEIEFQPFPKIARFNRTTIVTEKLDGTNASIFIADDLQTIRFASRTKWITPEDDNHGFAKWATATAPAATCSAIGSLRGERGNATP